MEQSVLMVRNYNLEELCGLLSKPYEFEKADKNSKIYKYVIEANELDWQWFPTEWHHQGGGGYGDIGEFFGIISGFEFELGYFSLYDFSSIPSIRFYWYEIEPMTQSEIDAL